MEVSDEQYQPAATDVEAADIMESNTSTSRGIEWSSPSSAPVHSRIVEAMPLNNRPYSEENYRVEYPLHPVGRLIAFIGFLFSGAFGLFLALGALMLPMLADSPHRKFSDNVWILGFVAAYLGITAGVLILSMVLLSVATSGVLVVLWKWEGRVPCPGNGLGCLFACLR
mmetsp:Transcript_15589/g.32963  ORF Transcript_15589/g.32963 Transcript_15589/m.32963 type:complete len:169 (-) Transcript_15589:142-648(-)